ncbi:MAG: ABC transporter ATP-binding protein, partial [Gammaproteobacteria bacterium]
RVHGTVEFQSVNFAYSSRKLQVLSDISFRVEPGETLAIIGRSGSGKSTLASLLPRFYNPDSGRILIDDQDACELRLTDLRRQMAMVTQDVVLFNDTVAHNIAYGAEDEASESDIREVARAAQILDDIEALPQGFDTVIGERGSLFSGGQRQRIAIARALIKNAPILILDEATSALDSESEHRVQLAFEELMRGRTAIIIAHRLSTVENADRILVLENGRIMERGTHTELLEKGGLYTNLHQLQVRRTE